MAGGCLFKTGVTPVSNFILIVNVHRAAVRQQFVLFLLC